MIKDVLIVFFKSLFEFSLFVLIVFSTACNCKPGYTLDEVTKKSNSGVGNQVKTILLHSGRFNQELISNGRLCALRKTDISFQVSGKVKSLFVKEGSFVAKGELIANLDDFELDNQFQKSKQRVALARLEMENILIGQGYNGKDTTNISGEVLNIARLRSGLNDALIDYKKAEHDLQSSKLIAPFTGVVANLSARLYQQVEIGKSFCTLIDSRNFEVVFTVMESEVGLITVGQQVSVELFTLGEGVCSGEITQINPMVDENGLIKVRALIQNIDGKLLDGLNVRIIGERTIEGQLIIPKSALLIRQNRQVVFTCKEGKALWNYVKTGYENSRYCTILEGLSEGDEVIVEGSLNLAHESKVEVIN